MIPPFHLFLADRSLWVGYNQWKRSAVYRMSSGMLWSMEIISIYAEGKPNYLSRSFIWLFLSAVLFSVVIYVA